MALKYPKGFNKMTLDEQEAWLSKKLMEVDALRDRIFRQLGTVRGGMRVQPQVEDVPGIDYDDKVRK